MSKAIEMTVNGLQCDAAGCGYVDEAIPLEDYPKWVNAPCPKCGAPLLTEQDFAATKFLCSMADYFNAILPPGTPMTPDKREMMRFKLDGTGKIEIEPPPSES